MKQILLNQGNIVATVDDEDYERVVALRPYAAQRKGKWYVAYRCFNTEGLQTTVPLHRFILNASVGIEVDHQNGDSLDNRRANLRLATRSQNEWNKGPRPTNTSGFKGVTRLPSGRWMAQLTHHRQYIYLGSFELPSEAARVYDAKAKELFGDFAWLNFPPKGWRQNVL